MIVDWRPRAVRRLDKIHANLPEDSFLAADAVFDTIVAAAATLPSHPYAYREGRVPNTREMVVLPNYNKCLSPEARSHTDRVCAPRAPTLSLIQA